MPVLKLVRRGVQIISLLLLVGLLAATTWPLRVPVSPQIFLRADPLAALAVALSPYRSLALWSLFWPALVVLGATALLGRFFCGWLCPLGTCLDAADHVIGRRRLERPGQPRTKFYLLGAVLAAALFGAHVFWLLDPLPLLTRTFATVFFPAGRQLYDTGLLHATPLLSRLGWRLQPLEVQPFALNLLTAAMFVGILSLGLLSRRYWCRNLCPLGALLALTGRYGLWRRQVSDGCSGCRQCSRECKMGAIPEQQPTHTRQADCVQCYNCVQTCRPGTRIALGLTPQTEPAVDLERRRFLGVLALGLGYGAVASTGLARRPNDSKLIRPPGALVRGANGAVKRMMTEEEFRSKCLRCGQCLKSCVTGGLQPAVIEAGFDGFYTPLLVPRAGWCEYGCAACGQVCPSGALVPFTVEEKKKIFIGLASIDHNQCLAWRQGSYYRQCLVCNEHCSYVAIKIQPYDGQDRPFIDDQVCVGCGICENACPVKPQSAIVVHRRGAADEI
jgi:ferredoxin